MPALNCTSKPNTDDGYGMDADLPSLSQQSNESNELEQQVLRETLEKCIAAEAEKKKAQKEKKFLEIAEAHLTRHIETSARDVRNAMKAVDGIYTTFLMEYAACEDRIQKKYLQVQELQANLVKIAKEGARLDEEANKTSSAMQVNGLSKMKTSCNAFRKVLEQLNPSEDDEIKEDE